MGKKYGAKTEIKNDSLNNKLIDIFDQFKKISTVNYKLKNLINVLIIDLQNRNVESEIIKKYTDKMKNIYKEVE